MYMWVTYLTYKTYGAKFKYKLTSVFHGTTDFVVSKYETDKLSI